MGGGCDDVAVAGEGTSVATCDVLVFRKRSVPASFKRLMSSADSLSLSLLLPLWNLLCVVSQPVAHNVVPFCSHGPHNQNYLRRWVWD